MTYRYGRLHTPLDVWQYRSTDGTWQYSVQFGQLPNTDEIAQHIASHGHHVEAA